jgi:hypothetical protein
LSQIYGEHRRRRGEKVIRSTREIPAEIRGNASIPMQDGAEKNGVRDGFHKMMDPISLRVNINDHGVAARKEMSEPSGQQIA